LSSAGGSICIWPAHSPVQVGGTGLRFLPGCSGPW
jgi:hypothetical protein